MTTSLENQGRAGDQPPAGPGNRTNVIKSCAHGVVPGGLPTAAVANSSKLATWNKAQARFPGSGDYESEMGLAALKAGQVPPGAPRRESVSLPFAALRGFPAFLDSPPADRPADSGDTTTCVWLASSFCLWASLSHL